MAKFGNVYLTLLLAISILAIPTSAVGLPLVQINTVPSASSTGVSHSLTIQAEELAYPLLIINGTLSPPPSTPSNVTWTIKGSIGYPLSSLVTYASATAQVDGPTGAFSYTLCLGGEGWPVWPADAYTLEGVWAGMGETANATSSFDYSVPLSSSSGAACPPLTGGTHALTLLNAPGDVPITGGCCAYNITYSNNLSLPVTGIAYLDLHNGFGQTVYIASSPLGIGPASHGSILSLVSTVSSGKYEATIFVVSPEGFAISGATSFLVTIPP